ncbi:hypothetical protein [Pseudooceanicola sp. HF7]|uniref:hypothetical protein n=1 Tax=Pseudooceanicola sp. HF7 TaxID=2721560 RepID=UPI00158DACF0|nr:hypothetical protein [Pseudooceanicola sp. HF7]
MRGPRPGPVFLARRGYRQRRLVDAVRLLPVLGVILLVAVPLQWPQDGDFSMSRAILYIFGSWAALTLAAALCLWKFRDPPDLGPGGYPALPHEETPFPLLTDTPSFRPQPRTASDGAEPTPGEPSDPGAETEHRS